jgi:hypothetical protein
MRSNEVQCYSYLSACNMYNTVIISHNIRNFIVSVF